MNFVDKSPLFCTLIKTTTTAGNTKSQLTIAVLYMYITIIVSKGCTCILTLVVLCNLFCQSWVIPTSRICHSCHQHLPCRWAMPTSVIAPLQPLREHFPQAISWNVTATSSNGIFIRWQQSQGKTDTWPPSSQAHHFLKYIKDISFTWNSILRTGIQCHVSDKSCIM